MRAQTLNVVDLFADQASSKRMADSANLQSTFSEMRLQLSHLAHTDLPAKRYSVGAILLVLLAHGLVLYWVLATSAWEKAELQSATPIMASIIALPAPVPEVAPVIEPKVEQKVVATKPQPKKMVEKAESLEMPVRRTEEPAIAQPEVTSTSAAQQESAQVAEVTATAPKAEPVAEDVIEPPRFGVAYLNNPAPSYPPLSRRHGEQGRVLMRVLVSAQGDAEEVSIETSSGFERLDEAAVNAVRQWRFIPAKKNHQPISAQVLVPMKFSLDNS